MQAKTMLWSATLATAACFSEQPLALPSASSASTGQAQMVQTADEETESGGSATQAQTDDASMTTEGPTPTDAGPPGSATADTGNPTETCGDDIVEDFEECDDGNRVDGDGCGADCLLETEGCASTAVPIAQDIDRGIAVCSDPANSVCEEDFAQLCAPGWHLCSPTEHLAKNDGWAVDLLGRRALGAIRCRAVGGAGHYTVLTTQADGANNCEIGSSRPACPSAFGCNETLDFALCCARLPTCGNGTIDPPFEECDDANAEEADDCTADCTATFGTGPHC